MTPWTHVTKALQGVKTEFFTLSPAVEEVGFRHSPPPCEDVEHLWGPMLAWATQASQDRISTLRFPSQICLGMTKEKGGNDGPDPYGFLTWYVHLL